MDVSSAHTTAAQSLQNAAGMLDSLAARLAGDASAQEPTGLPAQMAAGVTAASMATEASDPTFAAAAAGALQAAAATAAAEAGAAGGNPSAVAGSSASGSSGSGGGTGQRPIDLVELKLQMLDITLDDWARLPAELRSGVLQGSDQLRPEEYRELIKKYFLKIVRDGTETPAKN